MEAKILKSEQSKSYFVQWQAHQRKDNFYIPLFVSDKSRAKIYIDRFSLDKDKRDLEAYFKKYGKIKDRKLKSIFY